jgi:methionine-rich copper-binding protein CopC
MMKLKLSHAAVLLGLLFPLLLQEEAQCHAFPDHAEPRVGSTVTAAPSVRIWFDGALEPAFSSLKVLNASGRRVDKNDSRVNPSDATVLEVNLLVLGPGVYRVIWSVVARDGHKTEGDFTFTVK